MTTRKHLVFVAALAAAAFGEAGCATPGVPHLYTTASVQPSSILDQGDPTTIALPSFLIPGETLTGFAYDPFTDHLFLRLAPGNRLRVLDRPAGAVKREFIAEGVPAFGGGDLAVRPRDGHLFLAHPAEPAVIELTRFGKFVRTIALSLAGTPPEGVAYDSVRDQLLVLTGGARAHVTIYDRDGRRIGDVSFAAPVLPGSLGFDSEKREFYVPLASGQAVGVFDNRGKLLRTISEPAVFVDVGPRSFLRLF